MPDGIDLKIMQELIRYTKERAIEYRTFTGAFIVKEEQVIWREMTSIEIDNNPLAHAELKAIQAALPLMQGDLSGCRLYTTQKPCPMCASAMAWSGIGAVFYGLTSHHQWEDVDTLQRFCTKLNIRCVGPILEDECRAINDLLIAHGI